MIDLAFVLGFALLAAGVGRRIVLSLDPPAQADARPFAAVEILALAVPIGFGVSALAMLLLGELGWLNRLGVAIVLGVMIEIGWRHAAVIVVDAARAAGQAREYWRHAQAVDRLLAVMLLVLVAATALGSLKPVTDGDALCYHLQVPKLFLMKGAVVFAPDLHETVYPLVVEMLYAIGLECRGPVACRLLEWVLGLSFAGATTALAAPILGRRAWWAGLIALAVPAVSNGMTAPLNDVALAAFGAAAILAWTRLLDRPSPGAAVVAGSVAGLMIGVKYPALILAAILVAGLVIRGLARARWAERANQAGWLRLALVYCAALVLLGGCWHLRSYYHTGNPVFPFFKHAFGGSGLDEVLDPIKRPLEPTFWNLLGALGPISLEPDRFDSLAHELGPIFLLFIPALLLERAPRRLLVLVAVAYAFLVIAMTQRQSTRFLLVCVGPFAVATAYLASRWYERRTVPARLLVLLLCGFLGYETALASARARGAARYVLGRESASAYLTRTEPTFRVGRWAAAHLPQSARLIGQDHRGFYIPRDYTMELAHRRRTGLGAAGESAPEIIARLRARGFTHVLFCPPDPGSEVEFDPTLETLLEPWMNDQNPLYHERIQDRDGVSRTYEIYDLAAKQVELPARVRR